MLLGDWDAFLGSLLLHTSNEPFETCGVCAVCGCAHSLCEALGREVSFESKHFVTGAGCGDCSAYADATRVIPTACCLPDAVGMPCSTATPALDALALHCFVASRTFVRTRIGLNVVATAELLLLLSPRPLTCDTKLLLQLDRMCWMVHYVNDFILGYVSCLSQPLPCESVFGSIDSHRQTRLQKQQWHMNR